MASSLNESGFLDSELREKAEFLVNGHFIYEISIGFVAIILNFWVIFLIYSTKSEILKNYTVLIMLTVSGDLIFTVVNLFTMLVMEVRDGKLYLITMGVFRDYKYPSNYLMVSLWLSACYNTIAALAMQFIYRYSVLCMNKPLSTRQFFGIYMIGLLLSCSLGFYVFGCMDDESEGYTRILKGHPMYTYGTPSYIVGDPTKLLPLTHFTGSQITMIILYTIIFKTHRAVKKMLDGTTFSQSHTKKAQRNLTMVMQLQAFYPGIIIGIPVFVATVFTTMKLDLDWTGLYICTSCSTVPIANALTVLLVIPVFRRKVVRFLTCNRVTVGHSSQVCTEIHAKSVTVI